MKIKDLHYYKLKDGIYSVPTTTRNSGKLMKNQIFKKLQDTNERIKKKQLILVFHLMAGFLDGDMLSSIPRTIPT